MAHDYEGRDPDPVILTGVTLLRDTGAAIIVYVPDRGGDLVIPKSQVVEDGTDIWEPGDEGDVAITRWLAGREGLD